MKPSSSDILLRFQPFFQIFTIKQRWAQTATIIGWRCSCDGKVTKSVTQVQTQHHPSKVSKCQHKIRRSYSEWGFCSVCCMCVWMSVSRLPEVGDLLLSMSMDCWLSVSSVRPETANGSQKKGRRDVNFLLDHLKSVKDTEGTEINMVSHTKPKDKLLKYHIW